MKSLRNWITSFVIIAAVGGVMVVTTTPQTTSAAGLSDSCNQGFLGFPSWYRGLTDNKCNIKSPASAGGLSRFIWLIVLNIVEMAIVVAAYLSGFMFLFGGWMFIISQGKPETAAKARSIMTMAVMGLVLMISAIALVNFVFDKVIK